jgi:hypothetical protein
LPRRVEHKVVNLIHAPDGKINEEDVYWISSSDTSKKMD